MRRAISILSIALVTACLYPGHAWSSVAPSSVDLGLGISPDLVNSTDMTLFPRVAADWRLMDHISIASAAMYLRESYPRGSGGIALSSSGNPRDQFTGVTYTTYGDHFIPISAGIRLTAGDDGRSHGFYVEAAPAAYIAWFKGDPQTKLLAGYQIGLGVRVLTFGSTQTSLGMSYYRAEHAGPNLRHVFVSSEVGDEPGINAFVFHLSFGFGR